jgi:hypothetical protein
MERRKSAAMTHRICGGREGEELDRRAASNFATAATRAGVRHVVYLSGLGSGADLSLHLHYPVHHTIFKSTLQGLKRATRPASNSADASATSLKK